MTKAAKEKPLTDRQKLMVDYLPQYKWNYAQAALAAGFSETYARTRIRQTVKNNIVLSRAIEQKRAGISAESVDLREEAQLALLNILRDPGASRTERIKCVDALGKMNGWQSSTLNVGSDIRQKQLDAKCEAEVQAMLDERYGVKSVDSRQITGDIVADDDMSVVGLDGDMGPDDDNDGVGGVPVVVGPIVPPDGDNEAETVLESDNGEL